LVGRVEIVFSLGESFIELKYFHGVATPALLCHKEPARSIQSPQLGALERKILPLPLGAGSLWHKRAGASNSSDLNSTSRWRNLVGFFAFIDIKRTTLEYLHLAKGTVMKLCINLTGQVQVPM